MLLDKPKKVCIKQSPIATLSWFTILCVICCKTQSTARCVIGFQCRQLLPYLRASQHVSDISIVRMQKLSLFQLFVCLPETNGEQWQPFPVNWKARNSLGKIRCKLQDSDVRYGLRDMTQFEYNCFIINRNNIIIKFASFNRDSFLALSFYPCDVRFN